MRFKLAIKPELLEEENSLFIKDLSFRAFGFDLITSSIDLLGDSHWNVYRRADTGYNIQR